MWLKGVLNVETTIGSQDWTYVTNGQLWGTLEPLRANEILAYAAKQSEVDCKIRIRGYQVTLKFTDRLQDKETGDTYFIDGLFTDKKNNQLVVMAHRLGEPGRYNNQSSSSSSSGG